MVRVEPCEQLTKTLKSVGYACVFLKNLHAQLRGRTIEVNERFFLFQKIKGARFYWSNEINAQAHCESVIRLLNFEYELEL